MQKLQNAPKALTSMGYSGFVSSYFTKRELDTAYATEGLALDFWTALILPGTNHGSLAKPGRIKGNDSEGMSDFVLIMKGSSFHQTCLCTC